jgi:hypothetical protein
MKAISAINVKVRFYDIMARDVEKRYFEVFES